MPRTTDLNALAKEAAGNWKKFNCFVWDNARRPDAGDLFIWNLSSRDADLLEESNAAAIRKELEPFTEGDDPDVWFETHNHWAVGYLECAVIRVYDKGRNVTSAFRKCVELKERLSEYPILDSEDYTFRETEATLKNVEEQARGVARRNDVDLPDDFVMKLYEWFRDNNDGALENVDDGGGCPSLEETLEAFKGLGWLKGDENG